MKLEVRESQIEDILVNAGVLTQTLLNLESEPRLLVRQMILPSGRLDLLYIHNTELLLIELKAVDFEEKFLDQVLTYKSELLDFQHKDKLLQAQIEPYLLCTGVTSKQVSKAAEVGVKLIQYDSQKVLDFFHNNFKPIAFFAERKPIDIGIWNIHLIHELLYAIQNHNSVSKLATKLKGSRKTLYNKIRFAHELRLIRWMPNDDNIDVTELGQEYVKAEDKAMPLRLSDKQADILRELIMKNPYESSVILGIASVVESVFTLSKNTYPVPTVHLLDYFVYSAGKFFDWQTQKAKFNATRMYSNYAVDLGLLAKTDDTVYLTPEGFRFTIHMQMHKNLKMVESLKIF